MSANGIPGVEVLGSGEENLRFLIGLVVYAGTLIGMIIYLVYKLPRDGMEEEPSDQGDGVSADDPPELSGQ